MALVILHCTLSSRPVSRILSQTQRLTATGIAGSVTTFSSWMLESYMAFSNFDRYTRGGLHDVSPFFRSSPTSRLLIKPSPTDCRWHGLLLFNLRNLPRLHPPRLPHFLPSPAPPSPQSPLSLITHFRGERNFIVHPSTAPNPAQSSPRANTLARHPDHHHLLPLLPHRAPPLLLRAEVMATPRNIPDPPRPARDGVAILPSSAQS